ncbi:glycosyltransferase 87 family protein [Streptomyces sp. NPDC088354]|uniref:glycosyltransferase 87 family protein n=1 Tax=unclassified Streptomyces TaxID=2593676 RepID=UPI0029A8E5C1|nr:glycosyltransferase 87 family protein [Streptomyces sp. MI02-7b]MDX3077569.1 glycosyltransferase 87 family protein [Streptomyces sp. MI02-7b]
MGTRTATAATAALLAALTAAVATAVQHDTPGRMLLRQAVAWALFAAAAVAVRKVPVRRAVALVVAGGAALALAGLAGPPGTSDDMYRYAWDGRVQAAGISPYTYAPSAPELGALRDPWLFPEGGACRAWDEHPVPGGACTLVNRPTVHTIYPPVAEGWFLAVHALSPDGARHKAVQTGGALLAVATTVALLAVLRRRGGDPRRAALWAWCPAVPVEAVNNAHVDTLGVLLLVLALGVTGARRGALLGAAVAVKLLPVLALPGALSGVLAGVRRPREAARVLLPAALVVVLAYLPYVLASGSGVLGYLPGYLQEEGYDSAHVRRFALLRLVLPDTAAGFAAAAVVAVTALYVLRRGDPDRPWSGALLVTGTALLVTSPSYSWYALLVVALVALDGRWEWLSVAAAGAVLYLAGGPAQQAASYGIATLAVVIGAFVRHAVDRRPPGQKERYDSTGEDPTHAFRPDTAHVRRGPRTVRRRVTLRVQRVR